MSERPIRFFNTTGPCNPEEHYMLPPAERLQGAQLNRYIKNNLYWMLHAPRQTGKTTFLLNWMRELNTEDDIVSCYVTVETCQGMREIDVAMANICEAVHFYASTYSVPIPANNAKISGSNLRDI
ncbi:MAG: hypothetical protein LBT09_15740, partial [Planctomycetaceae bacterium]|nr:hypothetical protein [Planctomycetaceae bacterium]